MGDQREQSAGVSIGRFRVERELSEGRTYVAQADGRRVVLKALEEDCLLGGQLHPMVKDRLSRVRELAHLGVANLLSVERAEGRVLLVWEFIEGRTLEEQLGQHAERGWMVRGLARELVLHVESLHALGIVHGALHARNVIVMRSGMLRLTHVSPLLYNETDVDVDCLCDLLEEMGLAEAVDAREGRPSLREIAGRLSASSRGMAPLGAAAERPREKSGARHATVVGAVLVALLGIVIAWAMWNWARGQ